MNVQERECPDLENSGVGGKPFRRYVVNVDAENYMLRGVSRSDVDLDMFLVREGSTSTGSLQDCHYEENGSEVDHCGRLLSFHSLLCNCDLNCCCMCGSICPLDCHACFHNLCTRKSSNLCQNDPDVYKLLTFNFDKPEDMRQSSVPRRRKTDKSHQSPKCLQKEGLYKIKVTADWYTTTCLFHVVSKLRQTNLDRRKSRTDCVVSAFRRSC
ncbi:hypothetical protein HHI36_023065 [Cryptolaemus montrouzieri]|uniref:Uncharacterized protein n=1 Tax=Cryptolaemus montrouzieri TaxID=559131 RepID=A0ABD2PFC9_9CUCU